LAKAKGSPKTGGRTKGTLNKLTELIEAVTETFPNGEQGFWARAAEMAKNGESAAITIIASRLIPTLRPISQITNIKLGSNNLFQDAQREKGNGLKLE